MEGSRAESGSDLEPNLDPHKKYVGLYQYIPLSQKPPGFPLNLLALQFVIKKNPVLRIRIDFGRLDRIRIGTGIADQDLL